MTDNQTTEDWLPPLSIVINGSTYNCAGKEPERPTGAHVGWPHEITINGYVYWRLDATRDG